MGDGERFPLVPRDLGSCEIFPQSISHNCNGESDLETRDLSPGHLPPHPNLNPGPPRPSPREVLRLPLSCPR